MRPRSISPVPTADQNAEQQQQEPDRAATPPPPPPPKDIFATLASTLAHPMDAEQYYQSRPTRAPSGPCNPPGVEATERDRQRVEHGG